MIGPISFQYFKLLLITTMLVVLPSCNFETLGKISGNAILSRPIDLQVTNVSLTEGNATVLMVVLSTPAKNNFSLNWSVSGSGASVDFPITSSSINVLAGDTTVTIPISTNDNFYSELPRSYTLTVQSSGGEVTTSNSTITILDDDPVGSPILSIASVTQSEGNGVGPTNFNFTVTLNALSGSNVVVNYTTNDVTATGGVDYSTTSGTLTIPAGSLTGTITVPVLHDVVNEINEAFTVALSGGSGYTMSGSTLTATGTISNDDVAPVISISDVTNNESVSPFVFTVTLSQANGIPTIVNYATANGTATVADSDYTSTSGTLTIPAGTTSATISVPVGADGKFENTENFSLSLSGGSGYTVAGSTLSATGTITNDDTAPTISIGNVANNESVTPFAFAVNLSQASGLPVVVNYATSNGTATTADGDYSSASGTLTIPAGSTSGVINVPVTADNKNEPNETFTVTLSGGSDYTAAGSTLSATGTINNDDSAPTVSVANVSVAEGNGATGTTSLTFTVTLSAANGVATSINYATTDGTAANATDYATTSGTLNIAAGTTTGTITVTVNRDTLYEANETLTLTLSGGSGYTSAGSTLTATGTITNDDTAPTISIANVTNNEGNAGFTPYTFTVTQSAVSGVATSVNYATSNGTATLANSDYVTASGTLTIPAGSTTTTFTVNVVADTLYETNEAFNVTLSAGSGYTNAGSTLTATGTITNDDARPTIAISNATIVEGTGNGGVIIQFPITQSAVSGEITKIDYSISHVTTVAGDFVSGTSGTVNISPGNTSGNISVSVNRDSIDEFDETFTVNITGGSSYASAGSTLTATGTITDDDDPPTISISPIHGTEGGTAGFTVRLSAFSGKPITYDFATSSGTATSGSDFTAVTSSHSIAAGASVSTINVSTIDDSERCESQETIVGTISNVTNATIATGSNNSFINDNDIPTITLGSGSMTEGGTLTFTPSSDYSCPSDITLNYSVVPGTAYEFLDYTFQSGTVTIPANTTTASGSFSITSFDDSVPETEEYFTVRASIPNGIVVPGNIKLLDNDPVGIAKVSLGHTGICGMQSNGDTKCWGVQRSGEFPGTRVQVGDDPGELGVNLFSVNLGTNRYPKKVGNGLEHVCAILDNDQLKCWGKNQSAQLGAGYLSSSQGDSYLHMGDNLLPVSLPTGTKPVEVCGGTEHTCTRLDNGNVVCWGVGAQGVNGNGSSSTIGDQASDMGDNLVPVNLGVGNTATKLACSSYHNCAIVSDGSLRCWGSGLNGRLGSESTADIGATAGVIPAVNLGTNLTPIDVSAGFGHTCTIVLDNFDNKKKVKCWGINAAGQTGYNVTTVFGDQAGEMGDSLAFVDFGISEEPTKIWASSLFSCAEFTPGKIRCWGDTYKNGTAASALGDNLGEMTALSDISFGAGLTIDSFTVTDSGGCAIVQDAGLNKSYRCFGQSNYGLLGRGNLTSYLASASAAVDLGPGIIPHKVMTPNGTNRQNCLIVDNAGNKEVKCWGYGAFGSLGHGTSIIGDSASDMGATLQTLDLGMYSGSPLVPIDVTLGTMHACILTTAGVMKCMGQAALGQLGIAGLTGSYGLVSSQTWATQQTVTTGNIIKIQATLNNTCALYTDYTLRCWGSSGPRNGQGYGTAIDAPPIPINVGSNRRVLDFAGGRASTCVLLDDLSVKCFGVQNTGVLGPNVLENETIGDSPNEMGDYLQPISMGNTGGGVPYTVKAISNSQGVDSVGKHTCAILHTNEVKCWGYNQFGTLGTNTTAVVYNPAAAAVSILSKTPVKISQGNSHNCALFSDSTMRCWGYNTNGELGIGSTGHKGNSAGSMQTLTDLNFGAGVTVRDMMANSYATCAVLSNNQVKCWGRNIEPAYGTGDLKYWGRLAGETPNNIPSINLGW